jgi:Major tropism determinant N-terminal domain
MTTRIKLRRDTAANWTTNDPILALGEAGYDTTNNQLRVGDGISPWSLLSAVFGTSNKITAEQDYSSQYSNDDVAFFTYTTGSIAVQFYPNVGLYLNDLLSRWKDYFSGDTSLPSNYSNVALVINSNTTPIASTVTNVTSNNNDPALYTITLASAPAGPITIHSIDFNYTFSNAIGLDNDNAYYGMAVADENINFHSGRDINLYAADDFRMDAGNEFRLRLKNLDDMNPEEGIQIRTETTSTQYTWTFRLDGGLGLPDTGLIDNNGGTTRFKSTDNDGVQLGSTDDQNYVTVNTSSVTIQTNSDALGGSTQYNWVFGTDGSLALPDGFTLPNKNNTGYNYNYNLNGPTLQLSNDVDNQVIVTGPKPTVDRPSSQRIIIQGQRGFGNWTTSTVGEGGDVYIWGGTGGERNGGSGGSGGDVKMRGGQGQDNDGGYVRIEAGQAYHWNTYTGHGGFVEINAGDVANNSSGGNAGNRGGDVRIRGGRAYSATTQSGVIQVITGGYTQGGIAGDKIWTFGNDGTLKVPGNIVNSTGVNQLANRVEGSWTVTSGTNTYSFTLPSDGTYTMWVKGNIPNGILMWNATASVSNTNVPAIGYQYAWNYTGGGTPISLTSIPNQIRGVAGTISTDTTYAGTTSNRFDFGINNTSSTSKTVYYGYTKI